MTDLTTLRQLDVLARLARSGGVKGTAVAYRGGTPLYRFPDDGIVRALMAKGCVRIDTRQAKAFVTNRGLAMLDYWCERIWPEAMQRLIPLGTVPGKIKYG